MSKKGPRWKRRTTPIERPRSGKQTGRRLTTKRTREIKAYNEALRRTLKGGPPGRFVMDPPAGLLTRAGIWRRRSRGEVGPAKTRARKNARDLVKTAKDMTKRAKKVLP